MNKNILIITFLFPIIYLGCSSPKSKNDSDAVEVSALTGMVSDYFPSKQITKVFSGGFENAGMRNTVLSVEGNLVQILQEDTGTNLILVYEVTENQIRLIFSEEEYYSTEKIDDVVPNRSETILKAPLEVGTKWDSEHGGFFEVTAVDMEVTTPAGTFTTIEVTYQYNEFWTRFYFARDLGLIKTVSEMFSTELLEVK